MKSVYDFIIEPVGERYDNELKIGDKNLVLNSKIESHKFVNNKAKVVSIPLAIKTPIKVGDEIIVHHNIFRRYYNQKGKEVNSSKYFKDNTYFCQLDQIYMYGRNNLWKPFNDRCFVAPIINKDDLEIKKQKNHIGILKYGNSSLEALKISEDDVVGFTPNSEFEFVINDELLYCMKSKDIVIKYEHKKNKAQYNPSWAKSS
jgi:co-chaperonin GroES (HSP10)